MTQAKTASNILNAKKAFDIESFEKEYFELLENDPEHWADEFEFHEWKYVDPDNQTGRARLEMLAAQQKIQELLEEINQQEAIVRNCQRVIRKRSRLRQLLKESSAGRGRPERPKAREKIVKKFIVEWVASLMDALQVKGCGAKGGLEGVVSTTSERNWRRWSKGDAIPSYSTFINLLQSQITAGQHTGKLLCDVPVKPTHKQISRLLQFI